MGEMEPEMGLGDEAGEDGLSGLEDSQVAPEMGLETGMDGVRWNDMDMTAASDDDVIAIYKELSGEDEIEIVGDDIQF
jgi:hypothetical protein